MGGFGSGRHDSRRPVAEGMQRIDLAQMRREQPLSAQNLICLSYKHGNGEHVHAVIALEATPMRLGGQRLWFRCPACARRCRVLYGNWRMACRRCHGLRYRSQVETRIDRATRAMFKIVHRLDPKTRHNKLPPKPKGLHWATYQRLADRYREQSNAWSLEVMRRFGFSR